jgi:hypothetical protein
LLIKFFNAALPAMGLVYNVQEDKRSRECPKGIIPAPKFTN